MMAQTQHEVRRIDDEIQHLSVMVESLVKTLATQVHIDRVEVFLHVCHCMDGVRTGGVVTVLTQGCMSNLLCELDPLSTRCERCLRRLREHKNF